MNTRLLSLAVLMSCSINAFAKVSIQEKENRVLFMQKIGVAAPSLSIEAYKRELEYEKQDLPLELRARNEARLLAEKIQQQIVLAYEKGLKVHGDSARAIKEVKEAIATDLELADPEFKKELKLLATKTLKGLEEGGILNGPTLTSLEKVILPNVEERARFLNEEAMDAFTPGDEQLPTATTMKDSEKLEYKSTAELIESITSDRESTRWVATSNQLLNSSTTTATEKKISYQIKIEFLGVSVEAGPTISFKREYKTAVNIMGEEVTPAILPDGHFDINKKDRSGKVIYKNGKPARRYFAFFCEAILTFSTEYKGSGGFKIAGIGGNAVATSTYANSVTLSTRRVLLPDYVNNQTVNISYLSNVCHDEFLNANLGNNLTVKQSLNLSMKNLVSGLRFSHTKTKCAVDTHCIKWFNEDANKLWTYGTYPRCVDEKREGYRYCLVRGLPGHSCRIYDAAGNVTSSNMFEGDCDKGLTCVQTKKASLWSGPAKGVCRPTNPKTYCNPRESECRRKNEYRTFEDDYIMVRIGGRR